MQTTAIRLKTARTQLEGLFSNSELRIGSERLLSSGTEYASKVASSVEAVAMTKEATRTTLLLYIFGICVILVLNFVYFFSDLLTQLKALETNSDATAIAAILKEKMNCIFN